LCGFVIVLVLAEAAARVFFPGLAPATEERVKFWNYDELLGWSHRPNQRGRFNHQDFSVEVIINSLGMRDSEYPLERTEKKRMLVLGDSFGWGFGVEVGQRFSELLEKRHPDWEIMNASVSGYSTDQEFLYLREGGKALDPDVVLLLFHELDFEDNVRAEQHWYFKPFFTLEDGKLKLQNVPVPGSTIRQRLIRFFRGRTYLGPVLFSSGRWLFHLVGLEPSGATSSDSSDWDTQKKMHDVAHYLLKAINELCRQNRSLFILISIPMSEERRAVLQRIAEEERFPYLPLDAYFRNRLVSTTFPHDLHWNPTGHEIAANAVDAFLLRIGVVDSSGSR
jgi:hypothetical protein